jgi:hypothetical protein
MIENPKPPRQRVQPSDFERRASSGGISFQRRDEIPYGHALLACTAKAATVMVSAATADTLEEMDDDTIWGAIARHGAQSPTPVIFTLPSFGGDRAIQPVPPDLSELAAAAAQQAAVFMPYSDEVPENGEDTYVSEDWLEFIRTTPTRYQKFLAERVPKIRWLDEVRTYLVEELLSTSIIINEPPQKAGLRARQRGPEWILVYNDRGGRVGEVSFAWHGDTRIPFLELANESDRPAAQAALAHAGLFDLPFDPTPGWLNAAVQPSVGGHLQVTWSGALVGLEIKAELASFDLHNSELTVFAAPLRDPIAALMRRVGHPAARVVTASHRDDPFQVFGNDILNRLEYPASAARHIPRKLSQRARDLLPAPWAEVIQDEWSEPVFTAMPPIPDGMFTAHMTRIPIPLTEPRKGLSADIVCRLCDQLGPRYCVNCRKEATQGLFCDAGFDQPWNGAAIWALQTLADIEFGGPPALPQLAELPIPGPQSDLLMLCRMLAPRWKYSTMGADRKSRAWTDWLAVAGLLTEGVRRSRGITVMAKDGHLCRSLLERQVDDYLYDHGIDHEVEPDYPYDVDDNTTGYRADWKLPDGTFVEALGFTLDATYMAKVERKLQLAQRLGIPVVTVTHADLTRLGDIFAPWIPDEIPTRTTLPPRPAPPPPPAPKKPPSTVPTESNAKALHERRARAQRAVALQAQGVNRKDIATQLDVSPEVVKSFLRDGKFYADPSSDPERDRLAGAAAAAREQGGTRESFQHNEGLSLGRSKDAWRDAAILYPRETHSDAESAEYSD